MATQEELANYKEPIETRMQYGAPELKKLYKKFASRGLILAVVIHIFLISFYIFSLYLEKLNAERQLQIKRDIELKDIQTSEADKEEDTPPPPDIQVQQPEALKDMAALTPEPVAKEKADLETIKKVEETEKIKAFVSSEGSETVDPNRETGKLQVNEKKTEEKQVKEEKKDVKKTYQQFEVDKAPVAVNLGQVQSSMRYPEIAKSSGIEGKVTVKVLVGPDGSVLQVGGFSGPDVFRDEVSSKVMSLQFTPALQQGQPVRCWVSVPFSFKLTGKFKKENEEDKKEEKKTDEKKTDEKKTEEKKTEDPK
ncbi:MAG: TonB family protein [Ignavibacteriae bacterium]|nr:TonB family protein [Ignavibacteriota bacterium]